MPWLLIGFLGVAALALWSRSSSASPIGPSGQTPVWTALVVNPSSPAAQLPANSTFAISIPATDPNAPDIVASLQNAAPPLAQQIAALQVLQPGAAAPPNWPADGLGTQAYRITGAVGPMPMTLVFDESMKAWTFAGVAGLRR